MDWWLGEIVADCILLAAALVVLFAIVWGTEKLYGLFQPHVDSQTNAEGVHEWNPEREEYEDH